MQDQGKGTRQPLPRRKPYVPPAIEAEEPAPEELVFTTGPTVTVTCAAGTVSCSQ